jgi:hypothetical protein
MRFSLFSEIDFEISDPIAVVECYCVQNDFYTNYNLLTHREVEDVNKIGARIPPKSLRACRRVYEGTRDVRIFAYDLDDFLDLDESSISDHVHEASDIVIKELMKTPGVGLSRATKVLHTVYPGIIPMVDNMLQREYHMIRKAGNSPWSRDNPSEILADYYRNLQLSGNRRNLAEVFTKVSGNLPSLTKVGVFDILWWSYLKAKRLGDEVQRNGHAMTLTTIRW